MKYTLYHNVGRNREPGNIWGEWRPGHRLAPYFTGTIDEPTDGNLFPVAWTLYHRHNVDSRPCGRLGPSFSTGDVIVFHLDGEPDQAAHLTHDDFAFVDVDALTPLPQTYLEWLDEERKNRCPS